MVFLEGATVTDPPGLPRAIAALWGMEESGRRGPKRTLSVRAIGEAAVRIADADGLAAVSMASVAKELGSTAMSLYRYVDSRQELEMVMADVAIGLPPVPNPRRTWRRELEDWARAEARQLGAHPWTLELRTGSPPVSPNLLAWSDAGMQVTLRSGLTEQHAASALLVVDGFVRSQLLLGLQFADSEASRHWADQLRLVVDAESLPGLARVLAADALDDADEDPGELLGSEFEFGLAIVLDGVEALAAR
jgi:AcrR family transcriptional regulator